MIRLPPRSTRTDTPLPYTTLFRSTSASADGAGRAGRGSWRTPSRPPIRLRPNQHPHNLTSVVTVAVAMRRSFFADFNGSAPVSGSGHWTAAPLATACNRVVHGHQNRTRRLPAGCDRRGRWQQDRRREAAPGNEPDRGRQVARPVLGPGAQAAPELRAGAAGVRAGVPGG